METKPDSTLIVTKRLSLRHKNNLAISNHPLLLAGSVMREKGKGEKGEIFLYEC
jgi:hypothetical protein